MYDHFFLDEFKEEKRFSYSLTKIEQNEFLMAIEFDGKKYLLLVYDKKAKFAVLKDDVLPNGIESIPVSDYSDAFLVRELTKCEICMRDSALNLMLKKIAEMRTVANETNIEMKKN